MDEETREEQLDDEKEQDVDAHAMIKQANAESDDDGDDRNYAKK